jgi:hypothetical protein
MTTTLLLQTEPGRADDVAHFMTGLDAVTEAVVTSGPYDVIAHVDLDADVSRVLAAVRRAPGLARLCVCRPTSAA